MTPPKSSTKSDQRTVFWYVKFLFACYGAALALLLAAIIISAPFSETFVGDNARTFTLVFIVAASPFVWRYLK